MMKQTELSEFDKCQINCYWKESLILLRTLFSEKICLEMEGLR